MTAKSRHPSRREFVAGAGGAAALALTGTGGGALACRPASDETSAGDGLPIAAAGYRFPRTEALFDGRVPIEGCDATFAKGAIGDLNTNVFSGPQSLDVTEIGLHPFMLAYANDGFRDYTLLPVFPLRVFRHKSIFIRTDRGIHRPEDLAGKTIATPGYSSTSLTWIRGILADEYGVSPNDVDWVIAAGDSSAEVSGTTSAQEQVVPEGITLQRGPAGMNESDLLEAGEVDALFHAVEPRAYVQGHADVGRLFPDYRSTERAYFDRTGIFPIMHAVAIKQALVDEHPWLVAAVFEAYSQAKQLAYTAMARLGWASDMLPWYGQELAETRAHMGPNWYSYGIPGNRASLDALFRYSYEQGLSRTELTVEDLFTPSSLDLTETG